MITLRPAADRGHFDLGWLDTHHAFSFGRYYDPKHMGFRALRVINDDIIAPARGFGQHPHDNMEIITIVLSGRLAHKDTLGNTRELVPGMAQVMSAGQGIEHSEFNPSPTEPCHLYQIWIQPDREGSKASYVDLNVPPPTPARPVRLVATPDGRDGSGRINADAIVSLATLSAGATARIDLAPARHVWLQAIRGELTLQGTPTVREGVLLAAGDGAAISDERSLTLTAPEGAEAIIFDLA